MIADETVQVDAGHYPVTVHVDPAIEDRNRLTAAFRVFLALPHIIMVGAPLAMVGSISWSTDGGGWEIGSSGGLLSAVAGLAAVGAWFSLVLVGRHPDAFRRVCAFYLRWRVRATAYLTLLRDEYPPFGDGPYSAAVDLPPATGPRDRFTIAFRFFLALPHFLALWVLGVAWAFTTAFGWAAILLTGRFPRTLYGFGLGVLAWTVRVEAYMLLLRDEYPPFTLRV